MDNDKQKKINTTKINQALVDDNPKDDEAIKPETAPNSALDPEEIIKANNFLGDL